MRELTDKQEYERSVLTDALSSKVFSRSREVLCRTIGEQDGWIDDWQCSDSPDFYRVFDNKIVGIEHFAVDKYTKPRKGGREYQQFAKAALNEAKKVRKKYVGRIDTCDIRIPVGEEFQIIGDSMVDQVTIGDKYMFSSFCNTLDHHVGRLDTYHKNLSSKGAGRQVSIGCLIELTGDFSDVIMFEDGKIRTNNSGLLPLSHWLLSLLSHALQKGFDFVILYRACKNYGFGTTLENRLLAMDSPILLDDMAGYYHGEAIYQYIPASYSRNLKAKTEYSVRFNPVFDNLDGIQNVQVSGSGVDLQLYWYLVFWTIYVWQNGGFCYCDLEMSATAYALWKLQAQWGETTYHNSKTGESAAGICPYGFRKDVFDMLRSQFLNRYRLSGVQSLSLLRERQTQIDDSDSSWLHVSSKKRRK